MPRFVVLEHDHPTLHWDLMLEHDAALKTWRLPRPPADPPCQASGGDAPVVADATPLPDHRIMYLDYEGPVSGDRGRVKRWDAGSYDILEEGAATWTVRLAGARCQAVLTLPLAEKHEQP